MDMIPVPKYLFALLPAIGAIFTLCVWAATIVWSEAKKKTGIAWRLDRLCALLEAMLDVDRTLKDVPLLRRYLVEGILDEDEEEPVEDDKDEQVED